MISNIQKSICSSIINLDDTIRFVGVISEGGELLESARRNDATPLLDDEENRLSLIHTSVTAMMNKSWDNVLGKTKWTITLKDRVKLITVFLDSKLLVLSTESNSDHDEIVKKIIEVFEVIFR